MSRNFIRSELLGIKKSLEMRTTLKTKIEQGAIIATAAAAEYILKKALFYCPVETGLLKESGRIEQHGHFPFVVADVVFGSEQAFYAVYVHEVSAQHQAPTQWKFLEQATKDSTDYITRLIRDIMVRPDLGKFFVGPVEVVTEQNIRAPGTFYGAAKTSSRRELVMGHPAGFGRIHRLLPRGQRGGRD